MPRSIALLLLISLLAACSAPARQPVPSATPLPVGTEQPDSTPSASPTHPPLPTFTPLPLSSDTPTVVPQATITETVLRSEKTLLLAHFMPWYQSKAVSGAWGWHWTMNHFDPDQLNPDGTPAIASHFTPLTGPYDSSDPDLIAYQLQLMKLSGVDGVIVDWYGPDEFGDYATLNRATLAFFAALREAGLKFVICYEDQTLIHMLDGQYLQAEQAIPHARDVMAYLRANYFQDPAYLKVNGQPVLFVFGPQYFKKEADWEQIFAGLTPAPILVSEDTPLGKAAPASFPWPPMGLSSQGVLSQEALAGYLDRFYLSNMDQPLQVGSAFPAFQDIYQAAGVNQGYGYLAANQGETFRYTLQVALMTRPALIQLVTWNDYGEGTQIEPTLQDGYRYLEILQLFRRAHIQEDFAPTTDDLRMPLEIYTLRKAHADNPDLNALLDKASQALLAGHLALARAILASLK